MLGNRSIVAARLIDYSDLLDSPARLGERFQIAFSHRAHDKCEILLVCIGANDLDEMDMVETLEYFDLLFEMTRALLIFRKVVSTAEPFARVGF